MTAATAGQAGTASRAFSDLIKEIEARVRADERARLAGSGLFLSAAELVELTAYSQKPAQIQWLRERAGPFEVGGDSRAKVLREAVIRRLGGFEPGARQDAKKPRLRIPG